MEIGQIKQRLSILEVLRHYNLKTTPVNGKPNAHSLHCPFPGHPVKSGKRKKKTMQVYTDTNQYHCFEKDCPGGHGDVIDFIEQMEQCSKHEAIKQAKALVGEPIANTPNDSQDAHSDGSKRAIDQNQAGEDLAKPVPGSGLFKVVRPELYHYEDETVSIEVLGGISLEGLDRLRCTLKVMSVKQAHLHGIRHTLDLYHDDQVQKLVRKVAERLELPTSESTKAFYNLTEHLEQYRLAEIERRQSPDQKGDIVPLTEAERTAALAFLKEGNLMTRTNELLGESGLVGEEQNRQILWLVYSSRKRPKPLHVICLGASGTGKTYLQEKVGQLVPDEEKFTFTASTENAFYYLEPYDLCQKLVLIEDMDGVQYLLYPLRELQTKQWISKVVPVKDQQGNMKTRKLEVYGPICLSGTTTQEKLYEDNANRCLLLHLDNSPQQQEAIMDYQRKLSAGKINSYQEQEAQQLLQHIQRVLQPIKVINPYAEALRIPSRCFKPLRTNDHYLQFIETVTWYHQHQREEQADPETGEVYIETTLEDIALANQLMKEVLLTKSDELPHAVRSFFEELKGWLRSESRTSFYAKAMRMHFRLYPMKANRYLRTLEQFGYLKRTGGNKKTGFEYEVTEWDDYKQLQDGLNVLDELLAGLKSAEKRPKSA